MEPDNIRFNQFLDRDLSARSTTLHPTPSKKSLSMFNRLSNKPSKIKLAF